MGRRALPGFLAVVVTGAHSFAVRASPAPLRGTTRRASDTLGRMVSAGMQLPGGRSWSNDPGGHEPFALPLMQVDPVHEQGLPSF